MFDQRTRKVVAFLAIAGHLAALVGLVLNRASIAGCASILLIPATILAFGYAWPSIATRLTHTTGDRD